MSKKWIRREDVDVRWFTDGKFVGTRLDKNRCIYKDINGNEYVTGLGLVTRDQLTGKLYVERHCVTGRSMSIVEFIERLDT